MTHSLIRTRAEEDAADLVLKRSTSPVLPSTAADIAPITPSASSAMDSMWSEYEQYLQAARAAQEAGIDIFPQPAFVVKVSLVNDSRKGRATTVKRDLLEEDERAESESDKLFINVCTDACVDAPEIVKQSSDVPPSTSAPSAASSSTPTAAPPGSLRLPMSVGPLTPCTSRSGSPSLSVDVVIHPSTLIQPLDATHSQAAYQYAVAQAALIQRHSGTAPPILTPDQQQAMAMRELRRTVATFALQRVEEKYQLRVDAEAEVKFPKAAYKGSLPPPAQRIRRNKDNPLHAMTPQQREETERRGKVLVQEVAHVPHSKPASSGTTTSAVPIKAATPPVPQPSQQGNTAAAQRDSNQTQQTEKQATVSEAAEQTKQEATAVEQPKSISQRPTAAEEAPATTPVYSLDVADGQLILQVQLPGVSSSAEVDATVTSTDIRIVTQRTVSRRAYELHVVFPASVDDELVQAKFNRKKHTITLSMPTLSQPPTAALSATVAAAAVDAASNDTPAPRTDTASEQAAAPSIEFASSTAEVGLVDADGEVIAGAESGALSGCSAVVAVDWAARLGLCNRLIDQSCLTYH